jgi:hypothetical protein
MHAMPAYYGSVCNVMLLKCSCVWLHGHRLGVPYKAAASYIITVWSSPVLNCAGLCFL